MLFSVLPQWALSNQRTTASTKSSLVNGLIEKNKEISNWFDQKIEEIDLFLVGKSSSSERNLSSIKLINTTESKEGDNFINNTTISINPKLPNLEKFLRIRLSTYVERDEYLKSKRDLPEEENDFSLTHEADDFWHDVTTFNTSFEPRVELRDPLKVSYSLNFRSRGEIGVFTLDPRFEIFADAAKGVGLSHALNYSLQINESFGLRFLNEAEYQDRMHLYNVNNGVTLSHSVNRAHSLGYGFVISSTNRPDYRMSSYQLFTSWQWTLYRRVLDLQLIPKMDFPAVRNYVGSPGFVFNIIVNF